MLQIHDLLLCSVILILSCESLAGLSTDFIFYIRKVPLTYVCGGRINPEVFCYKIALALQGCYGSISEYE